MTEIPGSLNLPRPLGEVFKNIHTCHDPVDLLNQNLKNSEGLRPCVLKNSRVFLMHTT